MANMSARLASLDARAILSAGVVACDACLQRVTSRCV